MSLFRATRTRVSAITVAAGLAVAGIAAPAAAQPAVDPVEQVTDALTNLTASTATHNWKNSSVTRTVAVKGKPGPARAQVGDILEYTVTYNDKNLIPASISQLTDIKPEGVEYVPGTATYKYNDGDWADRNTANKWMTLVDGGVNFTSNFTQPWRAKSVTFTWEYRVKDIAAGEYNTGMKMFFSWDGEYNLSEMGPKINIVEKSALPGLPGVPSVPGQPAGSLDFGSIGSPSLNSPSLNSEGAQKFFETLSSLFPKK